MLSLRLLLFSGFASHAASQEQPQQTPEEELAARLVAAQSESERAALLEERKELANAKLVLALTALADRLKVRGAPGESLSRDMRRRSLMPSARRGASCLTCSEAAASA